MNTQTLSLAELEIFDSRSPNRGKERRFACPLCGQNKPIDAPHRSLAVNTEIGSFFCHRCQSKGLLQEFKTSRLIMPKKQKTRLKLITLFSLVEKPAIQKEVEKNENLQEKMQKYQTEFLHSPAEMYLLNRGISTDVAMKGGCGYAENWEHWEKQNEKWVLKGTDRRVIFPIFDREGKLVAFHGRAIEIGHQGSSKLTRGDKSQGLFLSDAGCLKQRVVAICEGAIDAMALNMCGISAVAMTGTTPPDWFYRKMAFQNVLIATDADEAGDKSAYKLRLELQLRGAKTLRLRPKNTKDWGEALEKIGLSEMQRFMSVFSENISEEERFSKALRLNDSGRSEVAQFVAGLITDIGLRENLLRELRISKPNAA